MHEVHKDQGPDQEPKVQVALTKRQWSAVTMAISRGVNSVRDAQNIPIVMINHFLEDIKLATQEIHRRLEEKK